MDMQTNTNDWLVLERRAQALAARRREDDADRNGASLAVLRFSLGGEQWAVSSETVLEAVIGVSIAPVPCAPDHIRGVFMRRGRLVAVVDLSSRLALPGRRSKEAGETLLVLGSKDMELALVVDSVEGVEFLDPNTVEPLDSGTDISEDYLIGVSPGVVTVLDGEAILADPTLQVNETVSD